jgi:hypothetical protein
LKEILENAVWLGEAGSVLNNFNTIMGILFPCRQGILFTCGVIYFLQARL